MRHRHPASYRPTIMKFLQPTIRSAVGLAARVPLANRVHRRLQRYRQRPRLKTVDDLEVRFSGKLRRTTAPDLHATLACGAEHCARLDKRLGWVRGLTEIGGVNPGDRFALAHLVLRLRPDQGLEIGKHVGASTASIAVALGNVLVEALACGLRVVATGYPSGPMEIFENGRFGRLVSVDDAQSMASCLASTLDAPRREALRRRAAEFTVEAIMPHYEKLLLGRYG